MNWAKCNTTGRELVQVFEEGSVSSLENKDHAMDNLFEADDDVISFDQTLVVLPLNFEDKVPGELLKAVFNGVLRLQSAVHNLKRQNQALALVT